MINHDLLQGLSHVFFQECFARFQIESNSTRVNSGVVHIILPSLKRFDYFGQRVVVDVYIASASYNYILTTC